MRSGNESSPYQEIDLDDAIRLAGSDFVRRTRCARSYDSVAITLDTEALDLATLLPTFRPDYLTDDGISIDVDANYTLEDVRCGIKVVSLDAFNDEKRRCGTDSGTPRLITFTSFTTALLYPKPKATGTTHWHWSPEFTVWTPGLAQVTAVLTAGALSSITTQNGGTYTTAPTVTFSGGGGTGAAATAVLTTGTITSFTSITGGSGYTSAPTVLLNGVAASTVTLNIPDDMIEGVLQYGVPVFVQWNEIETVERQMKLAAFEQHVQRCMGAANLGVRSMTREPLSPRRWRW